MKPRILLIAGLILSVTGCEKATGHRVLHLEEDGVPIIRTEGGPKYDTPLFEIESDLILGVDEGEPAWQMFAYSPVLLVAPDGRLVLIDRETFSICIVSRSGELLHQVGREGSGPGEFRNILDAFWAERGREFWVTDQMNNRITRISIDGEVLEGMNYSGIRSSYSRFWNLGHRTFMAHGQDRDFADPSTRTMRYAIMNDQLEIAAELFTLEGPRYFRISEHGWSPVPWISYPRPVATPTSQILLVQPNHPRLSFYTASAEPLLHIERDWDLVPISQEEKQDYRQAMREHYPDAEVGSIQFPDYKPPFQRALVDTENRIWLQRYEALREESVGDEPGKLIGYEYEIYSSEGVWLGTHLNRRSIHLIQNSCLYQFFMSEAGAPRLERLRLVPLVREMQ